jgi:hypothetical protein
MIVDWLKHAFITKFNHVRASVYGRFTDVLAKDVLLAGSMTRRRKSSKGNNVRLTRRLSEQSLMHSARSY